MGAILNGHYCQALLPRFKGISPAPEIGGAASLLILANRALSNTVFGIMSEKITNSILNGGAGVRQTTIRGCLQSSNIVLYFRDFAFRVGMLRPSLFRCVPLKTLYHRGAV